MFLIHLKITQQKEVYIYIYKNIYKEVNMQKC